MYNVFALLVYYFSEACDFLALISAKATKGCERGLMAGMMCSYMFRYICLDIYVKGICYNICCIF